MMLFKLLGLCLIFAVCVLGGFYLSFKLKERCKALHEICLATGEIAHRISLCEERGLILKKVFEGKSLQVSEDENYNVCVSCSILKKEDISLLKEFFLHLGTGDIQNQISLCETYKKLYERAYDSARGEEQTKGQMYKTCGCLLAVALIIFII